MSTVLSAATRTIAVVTGSRADFGLLRPVMRAIARHRNLSLRTIVTGTHLLEPARTIDEVAVEFTINATVDMQHAGVHGRAADARALARGVAGLTDAFESMQPDVVLVLGDRIETFAAAAAASISGIRIAHMHGGDRAEGIADDSLRHAITKLAHIHLPATQASAERIVRLGERPQTVHCVGSPAIDGLADVPALGDEGFAALGEPEIIFLLHPMGRSDDCEFAEASRLLSAARQAGRTLALHPNHDPGRGGIMRAIDSSGVAAVAHLPRPEFIGLLRRARVIVGNSSAGLIECAALGVWCLNLGDRQRGRERAGNVIDACRERLDEAGPMIRSILERPRYSGPHPYISAGGECSTRTAALLATLDLTAHPLGKINAY